jgi:tetratricopeptide (TPR) repeat protein
LLLSSFRDSVMANLTYWQSRVDEISDPALRDLIPESQNIYRAVEFGLALPESWRLAADLLLDLNYFIVHGGNWRPWQILIQKALSQCGDEDGVLTLRLLDCSGDYSRRIRDWESALQAHRQEVSLAKKLGKKDCLAQAHYNLGMLYWRQRQYERAADYARRALSGFKAVGATDRQWGGMYTVLGLIDYGRGNYSGAISYHLRAVGYFRETDFTVLLARSLVNLALAQEAGGEIEPAMASYQEARALLEKTDYEMDKVRIDLSLGSLFFNTNRFGEAEEAYMRAYSPYLKRSGLVYLLGLATNNLGNVYLEQGRVKEAESILRESLAIWKRTSAPLQTANTTGTLGKALAVQGKDLEALSCFDLALAGAEAFAEDGWAQLLVEEFQGERAELLARKKSAGQVDE